ncbi:MAG: ferric reductase-like transmembrane domain-containing protein [Pseudomonadota bacterium]
MPLLTWAILLLVIIAPMLVAAQSPLLAWRDPVYITAGFAGIAAMALLLLQPLLAAGLLPGLTLKRTRQVHRWTGSLLVAAVLLHVFTLWLTSPPDVIDVLLFASPTPFSIWGVIAMWLVLLSAAIAALRRRLNLSPRTWVLSHTVLAAIIVICSVIHALLIEGTMGTVTKWMLCLVTLAVTIKVIADKWKSHVRPRPQTRLRSRV